MLDKDSVYHKSLVNADYVFFDSGFFVLLLRLLKNISKNLIYFKSPIGKSLIGKSVKDLITVNTPSGEKNFEILEVQYI